MKIDAAILGNSMGIFRKLKIKLLCDLAASVQGDWSQDLEGTFAPCYVIVIFTIARANLSVLNQLVKGEDSVHVYTVKYGFVFRKK